MTKAAHKLLKQTERISPPRHLTPAKPAAENERERRQREFDQLQAELVAEVRFAADMEIERLSRSQGLDHI
jgi:hypothetical protein